MRAVPAAIWRCLVDNKLFALALIPAVLLRVDAELAVDRGQLGGAQPYMLLQFGSVALHLFI